MKLINDIFEIFKQLKIDPIENITLRQQLENMFKNQSSRYNFLDLSMIYLSFLCKNIFICCLDNDITGDDRLNHLKDRMKQCQKVFINLKSALTKVEKQRKIFLRRQKSISMCICPYTNNYQERNKLFLIHLISIESFIFIRRTRLSKKSFAYLRYILMLEVKNFEI